MILISHFAIACFSGLVSFLPLLTSDGEEDALLQSGEEGDVHSALSYKHIHKHKHIILIIIIADRLQAM
jgi:hypothetical protein